MKKYIMTLLFISLIVPVTLFAYTNDKSQATSPTGASQPLCSEEGGYVYTNNSKGPTACCPGLTLNFLEGMPYIKGTCVTITNQDLVCPNDCICDNFGKIISCKDKTCQAGCICNQDDIICPTEDQLIITTKIETDSVMSISEQDTSATSEQDKSSKSNQDEITTSTISISKTGTGGISIQSGEVEVVTSEKVSVIDSKLTIKTSDGSNKEIKVMPDKVSEILETSSIETNELKVEDKKAVYSVTGTKKGKMIALFPIKMKISAEVDAETGDIISVKKPWWGFLVKEK